MKLTSSMKLDRNRVDVSTPVLARYWRKRLRKSQQEIEAAIAKVGGNAETVMKELRANAYSPGLCGSPSHNLLAARQGLRKNDGGMKRRRACASRLSEAGGHPVDSKTR